MYHMDVSFGRPAFCGVRLTAPPQQHYILRIAGSRQLRDAIPAKNRMIIIY